MKEKEEQLKGRMVFPGQLSLLQAVGELDEVDQSILGNSQKVSLQSPLQDALFLRLTSTRPPFARSTQWRPILNIKLSSR